MTRISLLALALSVTCAAPAAAQPDRDQLIEMLRNGESSGPAVPLPPAPTLFETPGCYTEPMAVVRSPEALLLWRDGALQVHRADVCARQDCDDTSILWTTGTEAPGGQLCLQTDGNLVIYRDGAARWASGTHGWSLRAASGRFVSPGPDGTLDASGDTAADATRFFPFSQPGGALALATPRNGGWGIVEAKDGAVDQNRAWLTAETMLLPIHFEEGNVAFRTAGGRYLTLDADNAISAASKVVGELQKFDIVRADRLRLNGCRIELSNGETVLWQAGDACPADLLVPLSPIATPPPAEDEPQCAALPGDTLRDILVGCQLSRAQYLDQWVAYYANLLADPDLDAAEQQRLRLQLQSAMDRSAGAWDVYNSMRSS